MWLKICMALKFTGWSFQALSGRLLGKVAPPTAAYLEELLSQKGIRRFWLCSYGTMCQHSHVRTLWHHSWFFVLSRACVTVRYQLTYVHSQSIPSVHQHHSKTYLFTKVALHLPPWSLPLHRRSWSTRCLHHLAWTVNQRHGSCSVGIAAWPGDGALWWSSTVLEGEGNTWRNDGE